MCHCCFFRACANRFYKRSCRLSLLLIISILLAAPYGAKAAPSVTTTPQDASTHPSKKAVPHTPKTSAPTKKAQALPPAAKGFPISQAMAIPPEQAAKLPLPEAWKPLIERLASDGIEQAYLQTLFGRMGNSYSHTPMGTKINELFAKKYAPKPQKQPAATAPSVYKTMLGPDIVERCKEYLLQHAVAFDSAEATYGVSREVMVALLMVETRLGSFLGNNSALWSLACLAAADSPEKILPTLRALEMTPDRLTWVEKILKERSAWAYKELVALITHSKAHELDPLPMPGSVYGAIGLCQFMPSNLPKFAIDGDKDGKIDLFSPADAIPSVANYLKEHGWKKNDAARQHKALMRYNNSRTYANTILALGDAVSAPQEKAQPLPATKKKTNATAPKASKPKPSTKTTKTQKKGS